MGKGTLCILAAALLCGRARVVGTESPFSVDARAGTQEYRSSTLAGVCESPARWPWHRDGAAGTAKFDGPTAAAAYGRSVLVADAGNLLIRRWQDGQVRTVSGVKGAPDLVNGAATTTKYREPSDIVVSPDGKWAAVLDSKNDCVRRLDLVSGMSSTLAGGKGRTWEDGSGDIAGFRVEPDPSGLAVSPDGTWIAVADAGNHAIRRVEVATGVTSTLVGIKSASNDAAHEGFDDGITTRKFQEALADVCSTTMTPVAATNVAVVAKNATTIEMRLTVYHNFAGSIGALTAERAVFNTLTSPATFRSSLATALGVNLRQISDPGIDRPGNATRVVVEVTQRPATLNKPSSVAFSADGGWLIISDTKNHAVRQLNLVSKILTTVAGKPDSSGSGQASCTSPSATCVPRDGNAKTAILTEPRGLAVSRDDRIVLIAEPRSNSIRRLDLDTGLISTLAGNGTAGDQNGLAAATRFREPLDVAFGMMDHLSYLCSHDSTDPESDMSCNAGPRDEWAVVVDTGNNCLRNVSYVLLDPSASPPSPYSKEIRIGCASTQRMRWNYLWIAVASLCVSMIRSP